MRAEQYPFVWLLPAADFRDHVFLVGRAADALRVLFSVRVKASSAKGCDAPRHCSRSCRGAGRAFPDLLGQAAKIFRKQGLTLRIGNNFWRDLLANRLTGRRAGWRR